MPKGGSPLFRRLTGVRWAPYLFIFPNALLLLVFVIYPIFRVGLLSFQKYSILKNEGIWVGLRNYEAILTDQVFIKSLTNTVYYTFGRVPLVMLAGLVVALLLNQWVPMRGFIRSVYFFPTVTSMVVISLVFRFLFAPDLGIVSTTLTALGFQNLPTWLGDPHWAMRIVILVSAWKGIGYCMVLFLAGLQGIPAYVYEAARIDGASNRQMLRLITLPLLRPTTLFVLIISVIDAFKVFDQVYVMTQGGPGYATMTIVQYVYRAAFQMFEMGQASAAALVLFAIILILTLLQYRGFKVGEDM